jgi:cell fate (sporulation/competence/biofilm development) regulator YlbF (YheA/YmcA/DUF963 family)
MKLDFEVHSIGPGKEAVTAKVRGHDREIEIDVLVVELVREGSAISLRFDDLKEAGKLFKKIGQKITMTLAGAK